MIKKSLFISILIFSVIQLHSQTTYFVAPSSSGGSDSNAGTELAPFETLQHAINQLTAGDILNIREGTYRETITIDEGNISGPLITIQNYNNEVVTIDGTTDITGTWNTYDNISGAYRLSYAGNNDITQLFVDDQPMVNARWPNAQFNDDSIFSHSTWAEGDEDNSTDGSLTIDTSVHDPGSIDLNNSIGILNIGSFKTWTVAMTGHNNVTNVITYNEANVPDNDFKEKHHYYFFEGKLDFLDTNNEWFHDKSNDMLYLFPDDSSNPSSRSIKAKLSDNDYRVTLNGAKYVKLKGINFFATTINITGNSDYNTIEKCNFYFPSVSKRMLGTTNGVGTPNVMEISGNSNNNTIIECLFENSEGEALRIRGTNNTIENNYFHHIDWSASDLQGLMVSIWAGTNATSTTYTKNTIHTTGASATVLPGPSSTFSYNKVTNTGLLQSDGAVFQGTKNFVEGSNVHHNFVYDTEKYAFRYDAPGGDAAEAGGYGIMHHNIADNTNGLMIKGNNQIIAHNTVVNTINNRNDIIILSEDCSNTSTWLYNNIAERIGAHRSATSFSVAANSPMPIAGNVGGSDVGYIEVGDDWRACISTDENYTGTGNGSSQNNIDEISVSRTGISDPASGYSVIGDVSGTSKLLNYNAADGKTEADYMPVSGTSIIDSGISPTNSVSTGTSSSDSLDNLIPHTNVNSVADLGALEYGATAWSAGIDWTPKFHTAIWKKGASSNDWHTATNWSTGKVPTADVHVLIPTGASNYPIITGSNATCNNLTIYSSASVTLNSSYTLTISGDFKNMGAVTISGDMILQ